MGILNETQRRLLTYIYAANSGGYSPTPEEVTEWVLRPDLIPGKVTIWRIKSPSAAAALGGIPNLSESPAVKKMMQSLNQDLAKSMQPLMEPLRASQPRNDIATLFPPSG
jgi:hypothetical protein